MATISNETPYSLLSGTAYSDTITNTGHHVTIYAGAGNDSILNTNRGGALTLAGAYTYIDAGDGNDNIIHYDWAAYGTVLGGAGDDTIMSRAAESTISGGDGNDSIRNVTGLVSIHAGAGNDIIVDVGFIDGINHEDTLAGGAGDDTISLSATGYENVIEYSAGDGNDIVYNIGARDSIKIGDGTGEYSYQVSGSDIILSVGDGKISLVGAGSMESVNVAGVLTNNNNGAVVNGTSRADSIYNHGNNDTVNGAGGADFIVNFGDDPTVERTTWHGRYALLTGGDGDDTLWNNAAYSTVAAGAGNDSILNAWWGPESSLDGGAGNDYVENGGANSTVSGGKGKDTIINYGSEVLILYAAGDGNDSIVGFNETSTLKISGGTYSSQISGQNILVTVGEGKITLQGAATLSAVNIDGEFLNVIDSAADGTKLYAAVGNDSIVNRGDKVTIVGASDTDSIWNYGARVSINAEAGADYVDNRGKRSTIRGGKGNDTLDNGYRSAASSDAGGDSVLVDGGSGKNLLTNFGGKYVTILGGSSNDTIWNWNGDGSVSAGANISISAGKGNDTVWNAGDGATIDGGDGNDSITNNRGSNVSIDGGAGNDKVSNWGDKVKILGGAGADTINNNGTNGGSKKVTIDAGSGSDEIHNFGTNDLIKGGAGNDSIWNNRRGVINGEEVISDGGKSSTIIGGAGDDYINNSGDSVTFKYFSGDGNDSIVGFNATSTLTLDDGAGTYSSVKSGSDIIVTAGDGKITLSGAATLSAVNILGKEISAWKLDGTTATYSTGGKVLATVKNVKSVDGLSVNKKVVTVSAAALDEKKVSITGDGYTLALADDVDAPTTEKSWSFKDTTATYKQTTAAGYTLAGNAKSIAYSKQATETLATIKNVKSLDGLSVNKKVVTVSAAALDEKKVSISGDGYTLALGSDVDAPTTKKSWSLKDSTATYKQTTAAGYTLAGNAKSIAYSKQATETLATIKNVKSLDGLSVNKKVVTVSAAALDEKKVSISGDGYTLALADDVDTPTTKKSWSLKDSTATYKQTTAAGYMLKNNSIVYSEKISKTLATVKGVNDKSGLKVSGKTIKLSGGALSKKVSVSGDYTFDFDSAYSKASITGSSSNDTIIARGKNISISGGAGADIFEFKSTGVISDYEEADKISLSSADFSIDGSDVIINGKVTVAGAADKSVTYIEDGAEKIFKASADVEYNSKGTAATLLITYTPDTFSAGSDTLITIKASAVKHSLEIIGNKNANRITGTSEDDTIDGLAGGDIISGGKGDDSILGGAGSDSLNGGAGNDTLWGGTGSDTLTGGAGSDIFIYEKGDGKDVINDYTSVDTVIILSGKVESPFVDTDGNVTFQIGTGQLTFPNSANKYIELVNTDGNIQGKYTPIKS